MAWIKRNLFFVIGSCVALILMGVGIWMLIAQMAQESKVAEDIAAQYNELKRLTGLNPNPGDATIDNIKNAKEQEAEIRAYIAKVRPFFQRIPPIPDKATNKVSDSEFAAELRNTIFTLRHEADQLSVKLPQEYYFTFESQRKIMIFDPASLDKLAVQLGEVKALCDILFDAKVNSLDSVRRESVSKDDNNASDYFPKKTTMTPLADLSPYELTFSCFSTELALVLGHLANSPNGFIVKSITVEATGNVSDNGTAELSSNPSTQPPPLYRPGMGRPPVAAPPTGGGVKSGPPQFLSEKLFRVTLVVDVVKIKPLPAK